MFMCSQDHKFSIQLKLGLFVGIPRFFALFLARIVLILLLRCRYTVGHRPHLALWRNLLDPLHTEGFKRFVYIPIPKVGKHSRAQLLWFLRVRFAAWWKWVAIALCLRISWGSRWRPQRNTLILWSTDSSSFITRMVGVTGLQLWTRPSCLIDMEKWFPGNWKFPDDVWRILFLYYKVSADTACLGDEFSLDTQIPELYYKFKYSSLSTRNFIRETLKRARKNHLCFNSRSWVTYH